MQDSTVAKDRLNNVLLQLNPLAACRIYGSHDQAAYTELTLPLDETVAELKRQTAPFPGPGAPLKDCGVFWPVEWVAEDRTYFAIRIYMENEVEDPEGKHWRLWKEEIDNEYWRPLFASYPDNYEARHESGLSYLRFPVGELRGTRFDTDSTTFALKCPWALLETLLDVLSPMFCRLDDLATMRRRRRIPPSVPGTPMERLQGNAQPSDSHERGPYFVIPRPPDGWESIGIPEGPAPEREVHMTNKESVAAGQSWEERLKQLGKVVQPRPRADTEYRFTPAEKGCMHSIWEDAHKLGVSWATFTYTALEHTGEELIPSTFRGWRKYRRKFVTGNDDA